MLAVILYPIRSIRQKYYRGEKGTLPGDEKDTLFGGEKEALFGSEKEALFGGYSNQL